MSNTAFRFPFRPLLGQSSIGRIRWMTGILGGILVAILLFAWFYIGAQVIETMASRVRLDQISPVPLERLWALALLSGTLGTSITSWIWIGGRSTYYAHSRLTRQYARTLIALAFWFVLCAFTRFTTIHYLVIYWTIYDNEVPALEALYPGLATMVGIVHLSINWMALRLVFQLPKLTFKKLI